MNLSTALHNIHADSAWWRKVLLGGALSLTLFGAPWSAGLVVESMDNVRKGYPTPLPPSVDFWTRYIIGLFAILIDFFFFALPLFGFGLLLLVASAVLALGQTGSPAMASLVAGAVVAAAFVCLLALFLGSVAPVGRLMYVTGGNVEPALSAQPLRAAWAPERRGVYAQARIQSLPAYLPLLVFVVSMWAVGSFSAFAGQALLLGVLLWLAASSLLYAHLVVAQLYGDAERHLS